MNGKRALPVCVCVHESELAYICTEYMTPAPSNSVVTHIKRVVLLLVDQESV